MVAANGSDCRNSYTTTSGRSTNINRESARERASDEVVRPNARRRVEMGRKAGRWTDGRTDGRADGRADGWMDRRRRDGETNAGKCGEAGSLNGYNRREAPQMHVMNGEKTTTRTGGNRVCRKRSGLGQENGFARCVGQRGTLMR